MLTVPLAHAGRPPAPHDLWTAWGGDPVLLAGLLAVAAVHTRGRSRVPGMRRRADWCFWLGLVALAIATQSPLDTASAALASAHMVQHVLVVLVAAPLLAWSAPLPVLARGAPPWLPAALARARRRLGLSGRRLRALSRPAVAWLAHVAALWLWHSAALYDAALRSPALHALEHATFLGTALLFWRVVVAARGPARAAVGERVLLVFTMGMQSVFLSLLLTFATSSWYRAYRDTTAAWGLEPLADQQLAGVIMWVPAGFIYLGAALVLMAGWLRDLERAHG